MQELFSVRANTATGWLNDAANLSNANASGASGVAQDLSDLFLPGAIIPVPPQTEPTMPVWMLVFMGVLLAAAAIHLLPPPPARLIFHPIHNPNFNRSPRMKKNTLRSTLGLCALAMLFTASAARAQDTTDAVPTPASLTSAGYTQNFDSLGTSGTTAPQGWGTYSEAGSHDTFSPSGNPNGTGASPTPNGGTSNSTETSSVTAATVTVSSGTTNPKGTGAYNLGTSLGNPLSSSTDRALGTSPSGNAATVLELTLTNNTGASVTAVSLAYDIDRFTTTEEDNTAYNSSPTAGVKRTPATGSTTA